VGCIYGKLSNLYSLIFGNGVHEGICDIETRNLLLDCKAYW